MTQETATNNFKDVKGITAENADILLATSNHDIFQVFRSRNKAVIEPNVPIISDAVPIRADTGTAHPDDGNPRPAETKVGGTFDYIIDANDYTLFDLNDGEFIVQVQYAYQQTNDTANTAETYFPTPKFGNQCLFSLFQRMELYIDDVLIAQNLYPGMSSNAEYALRYPHCREFEKGQNVYGFQRTDNEYFLENSSGNTNNTFSTFSEKDMNQSITIRAVTTVAAAVGVNEKTVYTGFITQRIRLSDMFSVIKTLPPLFNHKVIIRLQRSSHSYLICNTGLANTKAYAIAIPKFKLYQDTYVTTDQFIQQAKAYYSKPIETFITEDRQIFTPIVTRPDHNSQQSFNINIDAAYKNKLLVLYFPRTTDFTNQYTAPAGTDSIDNTALTRTFDVFHAPANSYSYGGLRYLSIKTTNGLTVYEYDFENDGNINQANAMFSATSPAIQNNFGASSGMVKCANYEDAYKNYKEARRHFMESPDEALTFEAFMKEYCIFCFDLSCFTLAPNENLRIFMTYSDWYNDYNPYCDMNDGQKNYSSSQLFVSLFCDKVLRIMPNRRVELANLITTNTAEVDNSNMA